MSMPTRAAGPARRAPPSRTTVAGTVDCLHRMVAAQAARTPELVVALLAVLKAGACHVPVDPAYPPTRVAFVTAGSGVRLMLTRSAAGRSRKHYRRWKNRRTCISDGTDVSMSDTI